MAESKPLFRADLAERIAYKLKYFESPEDLLQQVVSKTVVPYQVEAQPGRLKGRELCWMPCPYCYGGSSENTGERLTPERYVEIIRQTAAGPHGKVHKIIFAGYATDPLNYEHIEDLVDTALNNRQIVGFHSKLLRASDRLVDLITSARMPATSYITISVDAGSSDGYNKTHGMVTKANLYAKVLENIRRLSESRRLRNANLDISANYLVTRINNATAEVETGIKNLIEAGADSIRLSFPQVPRGNASEDGTIVPTRVEIGTYYERLRAVVDSFSGGRTKVVMLDVDGDQDITERRTLPCFARFIYPAIAYDGYLSNCSQSGAPHFRDMALGNLQVRDFWDAFYDYDANNIWNVLAAQHEKMIRNDCRCDRKEHTVNQAFRTAFSGKA